MRVFIVVNASPWGDDRRVDSVFISERAAIRRMETLNSMPRHPSATYQWRMERYTVDSARKVFPPIPDE